MGIGALPFLLAMLLQVVFGLSPFASGMLTFTSAAGALFMKATATPIIRRLGFRSVLISNGVISVLHHDELRAVPSDDAALRHRAWRCCRADSSARCNSPRWERSPMPTCPTR